MLLFRITNHESRITNHESRIPNISPDLNTAFRALFVVLSVCGLSVRGARAQAGLAALGLVSVCGFIALLFLYLR